MRGVIVLVFLFFAFVLTMAVWGISSDARERREWLRYSAEHHCKIKTPSSFTKITVWACDGFEVEHE